MRSFKLLAFTPMLFLICFFGIPSAAQPLAFAAQSWNVSTSYPPSISAIDAISCATSSVCAIASINSNNLGQVLFTTDGGSSFSSDSMPTGIGQLNSISCPSSTTCIAVGTDPTGGSAVAISTIDGGSSWTSETIPSNVGSLNSISCPSTTFCIAVGENSSSSGYSAISSNNFGSSWTNDNLSSSIAGLSSVICISSLDCVAVGGTFLSNGSVDVTTNGGTSWSQETVPSGISYLSTIFCLPTSNCIAFGSNSSSTGPVAISSSDLGTTWAVDTLPASIFSISSSSCFSSTSCFAVGQSTSNTSVLVASSNQGATWSSATFGQTFGPVKTLACVVPAYCLAGGESQSLNGIFLASTGNSGSSWSNVGLPIDIKVLNQITCPTTSFCIATGTNSNGNIEYALTTDSGSTWVLTTLSSYSFKPKIAKCSTSQICFIIGSDSQNIAQGIITINGGASWAQITFPTGFSVSSLSCPSSSDCYIAGNTSPGIDPGIYLTTNNGNSWTGTLIPSNVNSLQDINCPTINNCVAVGTDAFGNGVVITSSNGTSFANQTLPPGNGDLTSVSCNSTFCMASGVNTSNSADVALKSSDYGSTWAETTIPTSSYQYKISCPADQLCFGINNNNVYATTDAGSTWNAINVPSSLSALLAISCPNSSSCFATGFGNSYSSGAMIISSPIGVTSPTVTSLTPNSGPATGGTYVEINGSGFTGATAVMFGLTPAQSFQINSYSLITALSPIGTGTVDITVSTSVGTSAVSSSDQFIFESPEPYHPMVPTRICDTRAANGSTVLTNECNNPQAKTLGTGQTLDIPVLGQAGIPSNASAVVANVTVTDTTSNNGYLTVFPGGSSSPPLSSNLNWQADQSVANLVTVGIGPAGDILAYNAIGFADVIVDIQGYYGANISGNAGLYFPLSPQRICDTRPMQNDVTQNQCNTAPSGPIGPGKTLNIQIDGEGQVPKSGVAAVSLNLTSIDSTTLGGGYISVYPMGSSQPTVSNVNFSSGQVIPNRIIVKVSSTGYITIFNFNGTTNIAIDIDGWFSDGSSTQTGGVLYTSISPQRICDTRTTGTNILSNQCNSPSSKTLQSGMTLRVNGASIDGIPASVTALSANVTVTNTNQNNGFLTIYPSGTLPVVSDLNWLSGSTVANLCEITLNSGGFNAYNFTGQADVIVDVDGFYS